MKWDDTNSIASFSMSGITLWATGSGYNNYDVAITNIDRQLPAESSDFDTFFGQALPPGNPSWDKLLPLTMEAVRKAADKGKTGFKTIRKLLNDSRFYK